MSTKPPLYRLIGELQAGSTLESAASRAGLRLEIAEVMVDHLRRSGKLDSAGSLCASGLGACGTGTSDQVKIHCAGCPLSR
ncbi:MAG: hypothetical protein Q4E01_05945 [Actinomycetaceae bacterium]|nr:hypothetical protein [Actinomycetaceae bacterium]